jgi:hypothetical protein
VSSVSANGVRRLDDVGAEEAAMWHLRHRGEGVGRDETSPQACDLVELASFGMSDERLAGTMIGISVAISHRRFKCSCWGDSDPEK